jgi:peptidoglycan/LPS O-acetylase OafA/YrhL
MTRIGKAALGAAIALSVLSVADAITRGLMQPLPPWDPEVAPGWVSATVSALEAVTFLLLAAVLATAAQRIDEGRPGRRWMRRALAVDLVVLGVGLPVANGNEDGPLGVVAGIAFAGMFLFGAILGAMLLRSRALRWSGALMLAPVALIPLAVAVDAVAPGWGHPGYAESALYVGIALLATPTGARLEARTPEPALR